ncbi:glycosyltransferase family 2 protein [Rhodalgimonas zhirmunskyi]|uniref:Glycosyltransferase n=1 Tax=Rhodalgimonas zhirmunskyi TaxID=2964767 RepID=A0AAJ1X785_9RHOB|nr:glycosyltransferase [Rhodoalgimonas zhirmunskyi]MDQ2094267.1 glycosyltransferase [Rhodoalgimonas zhirmunskyi]
MSEQPPATPTISIVIVSRGRPESLGWCLTGIAGLFYANFEVVVVACPDGAAVARARMGERIKLVEFDEANIAAARNLGIAQAAGEIVAFIDDDAVPEPTWLDHLVRAFEDRGVAAAGGFVRGRNGISFQWKAREVDSCGRATPLEVVDGVARPGPGRVVKTEGTNMAVRRDILAALGGFDPGYRFYLDETDLNLRLAAAGHRTAIVPEAEVHHAYAASIRRRTDRAVTDLSDIGASTTYFLRRHCPEEDHAARRQEVFREQQARVFGQMRKRMISRDAAGQLMEGLVQGFEEGLIRVLAPLAPLPEAQAPFRRFAPCPGPAVTLAGRPWQAAALRREAAERAKQGESVSLYIFSPTTLYHRVQFTNAGYWEQSGGLFGRSERHGPLIRMVSFRRRLAQETERTAGVRKLLTE